jgi:hypothetical protein
MPICPFFGLHPRPLPRSAETSEMKRSFPIFQRRVHAQHRTTPDLKREPWISHRTYIVFTSWGKSNLIKLTNRRPRSLDARSFQFKAGASLTSAQISPNRNDGVTGYFPLFREMHRTFCLLR